MHASLSQTNKRIQDVQTANIHCLGLQSWQLEAADSRVATKMLRGNGYSEKLKRTLIQEKLIIDYDS